MAEIDVSRLEALFNEDRPHMRGMISAWNQVKLVNTPLTQMTSPTTGTIYVNGDEDSFTFAMPYSISPGLIDFASDPDVTLISREEERMREAEQDRDDVAFLLRNIPMARWEAEERVKRYKEWKKTQVHLESGEAPSK